MTDPGGKHGAGSLDRTRRMTTSVAPSGFWKARHPGFTQTNDEVLCWWPQARRHLRVPTHSDPAKLGSILSRRLWTGTCHRSRSPCLPTKAFLQPVRCGRLSAEFGTPWFMDPLAWLFVFPCPGPRAPGSSWSVIRGSFQVSFPNRCPITATIETQFSS